MSIIKARRLYVEGGVSQEEAARLAGLSISYIKKVSARDGWVQQREKHAQGTTEYSLDARQLKRALLKRALVLNEEAPDSPEAAQAAQMWSQMETRFPEHRYGREGNEQAEARMQGRLEGLELIAAWSAKNDPNLLAKLEEHLTVLSQVIESGLVNVAA